LTSPTITWSASTGATSYEVCADTTDNNLCDTGWLSAGIGTSLTWQGPPLDVWTEYFWQVRAKNAGGTTYADGDGTAYWRFWTGPGAFHKLTPANAATGQSTNITLTWTASEGAYTYAYCLDETNDNMCDTEDWRVTSNLWGEYSLPFENGRTYYWQVWTLTRGAVIPNEANSGTWWSFTTQPGAFGKATPVSGATGQARNPFMGWTGSAEATSYEVCADTVNNNACDSVWVDVGTATNITWPGLELEHSTTYYWQVRAVYAGGTTYANDGTWWHFRTDSVRLPALDFDGDRKSDILWRHATQGDVWLWPMDGAAKTAETFIRTVPDTNWEIRGLGDQTGDGKADILWRHKTTGDIYLWPMNGSTPISETYVGTVDPAYDIVGTGDFNGDGKSDILWRHLTNGEVWIWLMDGATPLSRVYVGTVDPAYVINGVSDLDGDGKADIVWHHGTAGEVWVWLMDGATPLARTWVATVPDTGYQIAGVADYDGDGKTDVLWHHATTGEVWLWRMDGATRLAETWVATVPDTNYRIVATGDYDGDGKADILWHHATAGEVWVWLMDGATRLSQTWVGAVPDVGYQIVKVK
jgi:hypothetical protein